jgi:hypothetical protein
MSKYDPLVGGQGSQAFVPRCRREPGTYPVRMVDPVDALNQPHPRCLKDVRRIALDQLEVPSDRPDESTVLIDEALPSPWIAVGGPAYEPGCVEVRDIGADLLEALDGRPVENLLRHYRASRHQPP